jgi:hypothetical protein
MVNALTGTELMCLKIDVRDSTSDSSRRLNSNPTADPQACARNPGPELRLGALGFLNLGVSAEHVGWD